MTQISVFSESQSRRVAESQRRTGWAVISETLRL
jgi:hypothetical protein